jgi:hypothetical protein
MRLADGKEVLVVRVLTVDRVAGYGFTFSEDAGAARAMASWDAAAKRAALPLWRLLREQHPDAVAELDHDVAAGDHPWQAAWRAVLDAARSASPVPTDTPGAGIDWTLEPGFATRHWIEPEIKEPHGRTAE